MESLVTFVVENAPYAHWVIFGLLMLAGLNIPVSEDLIIISSGMLASTVIPENTWKLFIAVFLGAYLSDWVVFWLGRKWGYALWKIRWFAQMIRPERLEQVKKYYAKYGVLTLFVGRFIPFGVRNSLFFTAGMGRMRFWKFVFSDGIACLLSNTTLFTLAYFFGKNYGTLLHRMKWINLLLFGAFIVAIIILFWYKRPKIRSVEEEID